MYIIKDESSFLEPFMKRILFLSIIFFRIQLLSLAQNTCTSININFRAGRTNIEHTFCENSKNLAKLINAIQEAENDSRNKIINITLRSTASPEGSYERNQKLAKERLHVIENYIRENIDINENTIIHRKSDIAWKELVDFVKEDSNLKHKEEILYILTKVPEYIYNEVGQLVDTRKKQLMNLNYGNTWKYMSTQYFSKIRLSNIIILATQKNDSLVINHKDFIEENTLLLTKPNTTPIKLPTDTLQTHKFPPLHIAIKTNLLYDAAIIPNIGVELCFNHNWSIATNWMYAWWKTNKKHWWWRTYGGDIAIRKWLGKTGLNNPLTRHHLGIYGQILTYDFEIGKKGYLGDKWSYGGGIEYGYSLPVSRRLNIDFNIGLGYLGGKYKEYIPIDNCYVWQATKHRHWFGPTKAEISLVWNIERCLNYTGKGYQR